MRKYIPKYKRGTYIRKKAKSQVLKKGTILVNIFEKFRNIIKQNDKINQLKFVITERLTNDIDYIRKYINR